MNEIPRSNHGQISADFPQEAPPTQPGDLLRYVPPQVISYSNEDILNQISPVHTGSGVPLNGFDQGLLLPPGN